MISNLQFSHSKDLENSSRPTILISERTVLYLFGY